MKLMTFKKELFLLTKHAEFSEDDNLTDEDENSNIEGVSLETSEKLV